jgi:hypothetical protein
MEFCDCLQLVRPAADDRGTTIGTERVGRVDDALAVLPEGGARVSVVPANNVPISATTFGRSMRIKE